MSGTMQDGAVQAVGTWRDDWPVAVVSAGAAAVVWVGATVGRGGPRGQIRVDHPRRWAGLGGSHRGGGGRGRSRAPARPGASYAGCAPRVDRGRDGGMGGVLGGTGQCADRVGGADLGCPPSGGRCVADIAGGLHLSPSTVRNYLSDAIGKTGTRNRTEAALLARPTGGLGDASGSGSGDRSAS